MAKVVVKYLTGEEKTGDLPSFNYTQPFFHLYTPNEEGKPVPSVERLVFVREICFLKKTRDDASLIHTETIDQTVYAGRLSTRLVVEFKDGSILNGTTNKYNPNDKGFYLIPLNPADKCERIFVNAEAASRVVTRKLFGDILVDQKKLTEEQLRAGLAHQNALKEKKVGTILVENNLINDQQLSESLLRQRGSSKLLGEILVQAGYITEEQLKLALAKQQEDKKMKLGQVLVTLRFLMPNDISIALATQFNCAWVDLSGAQIPRDIFTLLPEETIRRLEVIPIEKKDNKVLVVATSQPLDSNIYQEVRKDSPLPVEFAFAYEKYISTIIDSFFPETPKET